VNRFGQFSGWVVLAALLLPAAGAELRVLDVNDVPHAPLQNTGQVATVFFFITHDCPISNGYGPEINRIVSEYSPRRVAFSVVYVDPELPPTEARKHTQEFGFKCPALLDRKHKLVKVAQATITPEAAILTPAGKLLYHGRIDDLFADYGKRRERATRRDLREALEAVLNQRPVPNPVSQAVGCHIPEIKPAK
jgi:hypothetical protein